MGGCAVGQCWENSEIESVKLDIGVSKGENSKENSQDFCKTEQLYTRIFLSFLRRQAVWQKGDVLPGA